MHVYVCVCVHIAWVTGYRLAAATITIVANNKLCHNKPAIAAISQYLQQATTSQQYGATTIVAVNLCGKHATIMPPIATSCRVACGMRQVASGCEMRATRRTAPIKSSKQSKCNVNANVNIGT